jgi:hypothetical protein
MLFTLLASLALSAARPDTVLMVASRSIDLTGDGKPEELQLVGAGPTIAGLELTFTILSGERLLYAEQIDPFSSDGPRAVLTAAEYRDRLRRLGEMFFADDEFQSPAEFEASLRRMAARIPATIAMDLGRPAVPDPGATDARATMSDTTGVGSIWQRMRDRQATVFRYQSGGDEVTYIAWNETDQRFYKVYRSD